MVPTRGRPDALDRLLTALRRQTLPSSLFSIVVVNDGSHDRRYADVAARQRTLCPLTYLTLPRRSGPAAARNLGVSHTGAEWVLFTDDDCLPPPGWVEGFRERLGRYPETAAVGGGVLPLPGEEPGLLGRYLRDSQFIRPMRDAAGEVVGLPTANLAVRRSWLERVGGFDERFPYPGGEDIDLTLRLIRAGARVEFAAGWATHHSTHCGWAGFCGRYFRYGYGDALLRGTRPSPGARNVLPWSEQGWAYRALTIARVVCFGTGRLLGLWRRKRARTRNRPGQEELVRGCSQNDNDARP